MSSSRMSLSPLISASFAAVFVIACSSAGGVGPGPDGGNTMVGGGGGGASSSGVSLTVQSAASSDSINGFSSPTGDEYLVLSILLANTDASRALPVTFNDFKLTTGASLVIDASANSDFLSPVCDPSTSVALGGTFNCEVAFAIPQGQTGVTLTYDDDLGDEATASVPAVAMTTGSSSVFCAVGEAGSNYCYGFIGLSAADASAETSGCTISLMGTVVSACSTTGLVGCCSSTASTYIEEQCFYSGTASDDQTACGSGTWTIGSM
jgi:hypothetical protein